ncbi:MAG: shikimate dehydrogenase [Patescibacteria group bacterium]
MKKKTMTKLNAVIGNPLTHSRSPRLHGALYKRLGLDAVLMPFAHEDVGKLVAAIRTLGIGLSAVTMPHKGAVIPLLDSVHPEAKAVGAVNTILNVEGKLTGHNTDLDGIRYALRNVHLRGKHVLIVGAGGAAAAAAHVVVKAGGETMHADRTHEKAERLAKRLKGEAVELSELSPEDVDVIVHATPVGQHPNPGKMAIPESLIAKHQTVFDLVYNPLNTALLRAAKKKGAKTVSGIDMFVVQGMRQVELWTGKKILNEALVGAMRKEIAKSL